MGLDTTHGAFNGPYSQFMVWRRWLAAKIGIPLELMEGFYEAGSTYDPFFSLKEDMKDKAAPGAYRYDSIRRLQDILPLKWDTLRPAPIYQLLYHSDCDGHISWQACGKIAKALRDILASLEGDQSASRAPEVERGTYDGMYKCTERFAAGCELAFKKKEKLEFH